jgi:hypothetical protein
MEKSVLNYCWPLQLFDSSRNSAFLFDNVSVIWVLLGQLTGIETQHAAMNLRVPLNAENFLTGWGPVILFVSWLVGFVSGSVGRSVGRLVT